MEWSHENGDLVKTFGSQTVHQGAPGACSKLTGALQDLLIFKGSTVIRDVCHVLLKLLAQDSSVWTLEHTTCFLMRYL